MISCVMSAQESHSSGFAAHSSHAENQVEPVASVSSEEVAAPVAASGVNSSEAQKGAVSPPKDENAEEQGGEEVAPPAVRASPNGRQDEGLLMEQFRRLRGPVAEVRGGDRESLRDHLVLVHAPLVEHCARSFASSGEPLEDLVQEGTIGLIKAVDRFDPEKGVRFSTYACHLIAGEMRHYLRDLGKLIHEPGWHSQLRGQVTRTADQLTQKLGRPPQPEEIADSMGVQPQIVRKVLESTSFLSVASLDAENDSENGDSGAALLGELEPGAEPLATRVENRVMLAHALPQLRDLEQRAVSMFYFDECTKTEIARELGISVNYAAYLVKRGVEHLRKILENDPQMAPTSARVVTRVLKEAEELDEHRIGIADVPRWIEESLRLPARGGKNESYALAWLRVMNWETATLRLQNEAKDEALAAAMALARRCSRKDDKIVEIHDSALDGLNLLALLPNTAEPGRRVGERWLRSCDPRAIYARNPAMVDGLLTDYGFVVAPQDGKTPLEIFQNLTEQLG